MEDIKIPCGSGDFGEDAKQGHETNGGAVGWPHYEFSGEGYGYDGPLPSSLIGDAMDGLLQVSDPEHALIDADDGKRHGLSN
jgi:hypothetical protein